MRFRNDSDEENCGFPLAFKKYECVCMRMKGHSGNHFAVMCDAARADGVCHGCRLPIGTGHREGCFAREEI